MKDNDIIRTIKTKSEKEPVPESLSPENIKKRLTGTRTKRRKFPFPAIPAAACILLCLLGAYFWQSAPTQTENDPPITDSLTPSSYEDVKRLLLAQRTLASPDFAVNARDGGAEFSATSEAQDSASNSGASPGEGAEEAAPSDSLPGGGADYSETNVQVEGVDEADILKTDGKYLYVIKNFEQNVIAILEANEGKLSKLSEIDLAEPMRTGRGSKDLLYTSQVNEMYLDGDRLVAICSTNGDSNRIITLTIVYDVSDREKPVLIDTLSQDGWYSSSRKSGNYVYTFSNHYAGDITKSSPAEDFIPRREEGGVLPCEDILLPKEVNSSAFLVLTAFDLADPSQFVSQKSILGASEQFYVSGGNIYATSTVYENATRNKNDKKKVSVPKTQIIKIPYADGQFRAPKTGLVDGLVNNSFSLDEYGGHLRMVTHVEPFYSYSNVEAYSQDPEVQIDLAEPADEGSASSSGAGFKPEAPDKPLDSYNALFVLDKDLQVTGSIRNLAPRESIYSARFFGDTGYFVTFRQVDPLFSVDLSNPKKPKVIGKLKIPGFSSYLHFYSEDLLLGIGEEVDEDGSARLGIKLSMFDISDPSDVKEIDKMVLDEDYSEALYNHKAVMIDAKKNLFGFAAIDHDRLQDYHYLTFSYQKGFHEEGRYPLADPGGGTRGVYIGDYLYIYALGASVSSYSLKESAHLDYVNLY